MAEAQAGAPAAEAEEFAANWVGPYELSEELRPRIEELGLTEAVEHFREHGYALIREAGPPSLMDEMREAIHKYAKARDGGMAGAPMLLGKHPAVDKVATLPKIMAFGEFACGKAMRVGRIVGSIKRKGQGRSRRALRLELDAGTVPGTQPARDLLRPVRGHDRGGWRDVRGAGFAPAAAPAVTGGSPLGEDRLHRGGKG